MFTIMRMLKLRGYEMNQETLRILTDEEKEAMMANLDEEQEEETSENE